MARQHWLLALILAAAAGTATATEAQPLADDPELEARVLAIAGELRCPVCQNETLAASQSALAADLRRQIGRQLQAGRSAHEVRKFMVERYGEFVLYRPAFSATTALLWAGPFALLGAALGLLLQATRRRRGEDAPAELDAMERSEMQRRLREGAA